MSLEMATTPEQRRRNFDAFLRAKNLKAGTWAKSAKVPTSTIYSLTRGQSDSLGAATLAKLASAAGISTADLVAAIEEGKIPTGGATTAPTAPVATLAGQTFSPVRVVGAVQAGAWLEALQWDDEQTYAVSVPLPPTFASYPVFGLEVRGPSMNELFPNKSVVFCVRFLDLQREPRSGEKVVVYRRSGDALMEATLKEFIVDDKGVKWLRPRSTHPEFQKPWRVHDAAREEQEFEVHALVIGSYRPEA